jgi:hypothetical protein
MSLNVGDRVADLRTVIGSSLGGVCGHGQVCDAVHNALNPSSPASDSYCCRATGSLCEAIYDAYYEGMKSDDRVGTIHAAVQSWIGATAGDKQPTR